jgi:hypothetical protein
VAPVVVVELEIQELQQVMVGLEMMELLEMEVPEDLAVLLVMAVAAALQASHPPLLEVQEEQSVEMREVMDHFGLEHLTHLISQLLAERAARALLRADRVEVLQVTLLLLVLPSQASLLREAVVVEEDLDLLVAAAVLEMLHLVAILLHPQIQE